MKYKLDNYKVGEIARFYGISVDAVRFYDRKGVLKPSKKGDNNYRAYSKEEFVVMDYIMRLRTLGVSIEDIRNLAGNTTLASLLEIVDNTENRIDQTIAKLENQKNMISGYKAKLLACSEDYGQVATRQAPAFIVKDIQTSMKETMEAFEKLKLTSMPLLSIELQIPSKDYENVGLYKHFLHRENRQQICNYVVAVSDEEEIHKAKDFPKDEFRIIPSRKCVHYIMKDWTNTDYSPIEEKYAAMKAQNLKIIGPPFLQLLVLENRGDAGVEYTEAWIPVE